MVKVEQLIINITDICDMACPFCLRGDGTGRKIDLSLIPKIFEGIDEIEGMTITGGEPGCYVKAITAIVDYLVKHKDTINVKGFFIATNGKEYHQELVDAVKTMLLLYVEKEFASRNMIAGKDAAFYNSVLQEEFYMFGLAVSMDEFHDPILLENWIKYRTSGIYSSAKEADYSNGGIISRGRAVGLPNTMDRQYRELYVDESYGDIVVSEVYVTVEGNIYGDCDMSYEMEEYCEPYGNLNEETLADIIKKECGGELIYE